MERVMYRIEVEVKVGLSEEKLNAVNEMLDRYPSHGLVKLDDNTYLKYESDETEGSDLGNAVSFYSMLKLRYPDCLSKLVIFDIEDDTKLVADL